MRSFKMLSFDFQQIFLMSSLQAQWSVIEGLDSGSHIWGHLGPLQKQAPPLQTSSSGPIGALQRPCLMTSTLHQMSLATPDHVAKSLWTSALFGKAFSFENRCKFKKQTPVNNFCCGHWRHLASESEYVWLRDGLLQTALEADLPSSIRTNPKDLVRRYLPPGRYTDLFQLYQAFQLSQNQPAASARTFWRVLKARKVQRFVCLFQTAHFLSKLKIGPRLLQGIWC